MNLRGIIPDNRFESFLGWRPLAIRSLIGYEYPKKTGEESITLCSKKKIVRKLGVRVHQFLHFIESKFCCDNVSGS
jgi:hypothetical protein